MAKKKGHKITEAYLLQQQAKGMIRGFTVTSLPSAKSQVTSVPKAQEPANKFRNTPTVHNGINFQSRKECTRYKDLLLMMKAGQIGQLELQKKFVLVPAQTQPIIGKRGKPLKKVRVVERETAYFADFAYVDIVAGYVVNDTKSDATRRLSTYIIKRKLMLERFGIAILET